MFTVQITPEYLSGLESNLTGETEGIGPTLGDTMALIQYAKRAIKQTGNVSVEYAWPKEAAASGSGSTSP